MKATDYYDRYRKNLTDALNIETIPGLTSEEKKEMLDRQNNAIVECFREHIAEVKELQKKRNSRTNKAIVACIKEINAKWNKLGRLLEENYGTSIIKKNCVNREFAESIPGIGEFLDLSE